MSNEIDIHKTHWMVREPETGTLDSFRTEQEAMDKARAIVAGGPEESLVGQWVPKYRIHRPKIAVESIDAPRRQSKPRKRKGGDGDQTQQCGPQLEGMGAPSPAAEPELPIGLRRTA